MVTDNSDKPGQHDFKILQRLVLPDGSVLRAKYAGRPSRDCLFDDPVMDGRRYNYLPTIFSFFILLINYSLCFHVNFCIVQNKSLLKIWNLNKCTGVIGVFNCQGAGSWPCHDNNNTIKRTESHELSGQVSPADIEYFEEVSGKSWMGDCAVFSFSSGI